MKYFIFCYNMLTLTRSLYYTENVWGKKNTQIFYSDVFSKLPANIKQDYSITVISKDGLDKERGIKAIVDSCLWTKKICKYIYKSTASYENFTLIIFRDNELQEASLIEFLKQKFKRKMHVCLFEEGAGLYAKSKTPTRYRKLKKIVYDIFGLSKYSLLDRTQGLNENVDIVVCTRPEEYRAKRQDGKAIIVEKMKDVFTKQLSDYITESIIDNSVSDQKFDYVFLTQPFSMFRDDVNSINETYEKLLPRVFSILSQKGDVLIKLHPREEYDYSRFVNEHISISTDKEKSVPFECLLTNYGYPQMISMYSSVSFNIVTEKPSVFLFRIFKIPNSDSLFTESDLINSNIVVCDSFEEFDYITN